MQHSLCKFWLTLAILFLPLQHLQMPSYRFSLCHAWPSDGFSSQIWSWACSAELSPPPADGRSCQGFQASPSCFWAPPPSPPSPPSPRKMQHPCSFLHTDTPRHLSFTPIKSDSSKQQGQTLPIAAGLRADCSTLHFQDFETRNGALFFWHRRMAPAEGKALHCFILSASSHFPQGIACSPLQLITSLFQEKLTAASSSSFSSQRPNTV